MQFNNTPIFILKIIHLNHSDSIGGAARAAYRIHRALCSLDIDSRLWVNKKFSGDWTVVGPETKYEKFMMEIRPRLTSLLLKFLGCQGGGLRSPQIFGSDWIVRINDSDADIVHLHWVQGEMLSIKDIAKINKPIVWTLHDMWAFCGAEHYSFNDRWIKGYTRENRPVTESGFDIDYWAWNRKKRLWTRPIFIVPDSKWLASCARQSRLMRDWPISHINYPLDLDVWSPIDKALARKIMNLPQDKLLIAFGAMEGVSDERKGFDLLLEALHCIKKENGQNDVELLVFGQLAPKIPLKVGVPIHFSGHLFDDLSLRMVYSAANVMVVPSRLEAFGQTASEALACGTPVVAFDNSGLTDIVDHKSNGYLAKAFDSNDLAAGIMWVLKNNHRDILGKNSRNSAVAKFSYEYIAKKYLEIYSSLI